MLALKSKPCRRYKKSLALLATSALTDCESTAVREHMGDCAGCREYFDAIKTLCDAHQTVAKNLSSSVPGLELNQRLFSGINDRASSSGNFISLITTIWRERLVGVCTGVAMLGCILAVTFWPRHERQSFDQAAPEKMQTHFVADPPPSNQIIYRLAVNRSFEEFDRLLSRDAGGGSANSEPVYRLHSVLRDSEF